VQRPRVPRFVIRKFKQQLRRLEVSTAFARIDKVIE
jgi:hypothetical protein